MKMSLKNIEGLEKSFGNHLIKETAELMLRHTPKEVEPVFDSRLDLIYQKKSGVVSLFRWFLAKSRMRRKSVKNNIEHHYLTSLTTLQITEKQAMGYLLLAANGMDFLMEQIRVFEAETHLLLRTVPHEEAKQTFNKYFSHI